MSIQLFVCLCIYVLVNKNLSENMFCIGDKSVCVRACVCVCEYMYIYVYIYKLTVAITSGSTTASGTWSTCGRLGFRRRRRWACQEAGPRAPPGPRQRPCARRGRRGRRAWASETSARRGPPGPPTARASPRPRSHPPVMGKESHLSRKNL